MRADLLRRALVALLLATVPACASLAEGGGGDQNLPNAASGPFREIRSEELGNSRPAPNGLENGDTFPRDIAVLDVDGDPSTLPVLGWAAVNIAPEGAEASFDLPPNAIVRFNALDGRSFDRNPVNVLEASGPTDFVASPSVVRDGGEVLLFFDTPDGVALATGTDAESLSREDGVVFGPGGDGWDAGAMPRRPGLVVLGNGTLRMFYEVEVVAGRTAIGEAASSDGRTWTRLGQGPVLAPREPAVGDEAARWDDVAVGAPFPVLEADETGRTIVRVYHTATDHDGIQVIALAARYGDGGPLERATGPVFGVNSGLDPHEPCVLRFDGFTLLYTTQRASSSDAEANPAVAIGVAPATVTLPAPVD